jgi:methylated-DNA-[protein]-cysteine S-methyltransferase
VTATRTHAVLDGPLGPMTVVGQDGALAGLYLHEQRHLPPADHLGERDDTTLPALQEQLGAYLAGQLRTFDVTLAQVGTPFQTEVWTALRRVPYGTTTTYGALAAAVGRRRRSRAVGAANGRNPCCLVVPCPPRGRRRRQPHRVRRRAGPQALPARPRAERGHRGTASCAARLTDRRTAGQPPARSAIRARKKRPARRRGRRR